ncbi:MAG: DUF624 domain-containing protein [Clostridiales bacterium]|nr:DUF624 domain-containing protein [Clostridiales bacterium]
MPEREKIVGHKFMRLINLLISRFWDISKVNVYSVLLYLPSFAIMFYLSLSVFPADFDKLASIFIYTVEDVALINALVRMAVGLVFMTIPMIVFGPAAAGAANVFKLIIANKSIQVWSIMWQSMKKHFLKSFIVSGISTVIMYVSLLSLRIWIQLQNNSEFISGLKSNDVIDSLIKFLLGNKFFFVMIIILILLFILIFTMMHLYIYQLLVQYDLSITKLFKYSYTFAILRFIPNLLIVIVCMALTVIPYWIHYLFGGGMTMFVTFGLCGLIINYYTWPALEKHFEPLVDRK